MSEIQTPNEALNPEVTSFEAPVIEHPFGTRVFFKAPIVKTDASPGYLYEITIPKLGSEYVIVPNSINLVYEFKAAGTKAFFKQSLSRQLVRELQIRMGAKVIYDCRQEALFGTYADLWKQREKL